MGTGEKARPGEKRPGLLAAIPTTEAGPIESAQV
jgi:hypothetical protein